MGTGERRQACEVGTTDRRALRGDRRQDDPAKAAAFASGIGITYDLWSDELGDVFATLDLSTIPTTHFLDARGRIVVTHTGAMPRSPSRAAPPPLWRSRCAIKRDLRPLA